MRNFIKILKKIIFSFLLLFGLNTMLKYVGIIIPINFINLLNYDTSINFIIQQNMVKRLIIAMEALIIMCYYIAYFS